jgi:hypothetical protein
MRGSDHATDFRAYSLTATGAVMGESLAGYHGITTGVPSLDGERRDGNIGLTGRETVLLETLVRLKSASAEQLAAQTGVSMATIRADLARLSALGYVDGDGTNGTTFRAIARPARAG